MPRKDTTPATPFDTTKFYFLPKEEISRLLSQAVYGLTISWKSDGTFQGGMEYLRVLIGDYPLPRHLQERTGRYEGSAVRYMSSAEKNHLLGSYYANKATEKLAEYEI